MCPSENGEHGSMYGSVDDVEARMNLVKRGSLRAPDLFHERSFNCDESIDDLEESAEMKDIDATIDLVIPMTAGADVVMQYHPQKFWLWRQFHGTIFQHGLRTALGYMIFTAIVTQVLGMIDDPDDPSDAVSNSLLAFNQVWKIMLPLTTFIMTFFLNQAYSMWRQVYNLSRSVQGRTNDFGFLAATSAVRDAEGRYTPEARKILDDISMAVRIIHIFCYATRTRRYRILHTTRALKRMVERRVLSQEMFDAIMKLEISPANRIYAIIEWIVIRFRVGLEDGSLKGGPGFEQMFLEKGLMLRSQYGSFADILDARIPLAYVHFVQVMVDTMLICSPFALYKDMAFFSVPCVGVLTLFFAGLLDLSKVMLDPFDNEDYCDGVIDMNIFVFIRESNNGSIRFMKGAEWLPKGWLG
eukprot:CAMPEP_0178545836 /NCGR_PEP_ID=MMETSP0697-20121206/3848_1 /TAXON_ID=265572 /ORGANISM="Extubocellulus spinifer, Strain CCMP396" /LENGTH=412 /DNA_ID=CAMNT_0020178417 /DNA_START=170 /DNA_END=1408 /DNA_ORIENTATION=-